MYIYIYIYVFDVHNIHISMMKLHVYDCICIQLMSIISFILKYIRNIKKHTKLNSDDR